MSIPHIFYPYLSLISTLMVSATCQLAMRPGCLHGVFFSECFHSTAHNNFFHDCLIPSLLDDISFTCIHNHIYIYISFTVDKIFDLKFFNFELGGSQFVWHILNALTLNVCVPSYLSLIRSISWLLLASPGHQQPWYWLCKMGKFWSDMKKDFNCLARQCGRMT